MQFNFSALWMIVVSESCIAIISGSRLSRMPPFMRTQKDVTHFYKIQLAVYAPGAVLAMLRVTFGLFGISRLNVTLLKAYRVCVVISIFLTIAVVVIVNPYFSIKLMTLCISFAAAHILIKELEENNQQEVFL